jgi:nicotinamidase-related amidase
MRRPAIFVIDMLNDCFVHAELQRLRPSLCSSINALTAMARATGHPVIWVRQAFEPDLSDATLEMKRKNIHMFIKGTAGPLLLDELHRSDSDLEVVKKRYSMFFQTDLDALLQRLGTDQIILAGVNTHACIRAAAMDAYQRDFEVMIVRECVASKDAHHHDVTMDYLNGGIARVVALDELKVRILEGYKSPAPSKPFPNFKR